MKLKVSFVAEQHQTHVLLEKWIVNFVVMASTVLAFINNQSCTVSGE